MYFKQNLHIFHHIIEQHSHRFHTAVSKCNVKIPTDIIHLSHVFTTNILALVLQWWSEDGSPGLLLAHSQLNKGNRKERVFSNQHMKASQSPYLQSITLQIMWPFPIRQCICLTLQMYHGAWEMYCGIWGLMSLKKGTSYHHSQLSPHACYCTSKW